MVAQLPVSGRDRNPHAEKKGPPPQARQPTVLRSGKPVRQADSTIHRHRTDQREDEEHEDKFSTFGHKAPIIPLPPPEAIPKNTGFSPRCAFRWHFARF